MNTDYTQLEGGHETVSQTVMALLQAGESVSVRNHNSTRKLDGSDYDLTNNENRTSFVSDNGNGTVAAEIYDDSTVTVRHD